jgi:hypothetical protein
MSRNAEGCYCCECDYCRVSPCDKTPTEVVCLSDSLTNNYQFCWGHRAEARAAILTYLAAHPNVRIEDDGSWREELAEYFHAS